MHGKKYRAAKEKAPTQAVTLPEAVAFLKEHPVAKFDETVEVHVRLGINPARSDQVVRGNVSLPAGTPKQKRVAVFASGASEQKAATAAGAVIVGGEELIKKITADGKLEVDSVVATPD